MRFYLKYETNINPHRQLCFNNVDSKQSGFSFSLAKTLVFVNNVLCDRFFFETFTFIFAKNRVSTDLRNSRFLQKTLDC